MHGTAVFSSSLAENLQGSGPILWAVFSTRIGSRKQEQEQSVKIVLTDVGRPSILVVSDKQQDQEGWYLPTGTVQDGTVDSVVRLVKDITGLTSLQAGDAQRWPS